MDDINITVFSNKMRLCFLVEFYLKLYLYYRQWQSQWWWWWWCIN